MKILFLILGTKKSPWDSIELGQQQTWIKDLPEDDEYKFIYGDGNLGFSTDNPADLHQIKFSENDSPLDIHDPISLSQNSWTFPSRSGWSELLSNTVSGFRYALSCSDFRYLIRTNVSSYWNSSSTHKLIQSLPKEKLYAGSKTRFWADPACEYVSGNGIILSRDTVELIVEKHQAIDGRIIDDVALGLFLDSEGVQITNAESLQFENIDQVEKASLAVLKQAHVFRCKSEIQGWNGKIERKDTDIFKAIYCRLQEA
jgi:hypothetical protein